VSRCPTPTKVAYDSRRAAGFFANTDGLRPYKCPCGKWHLSSKGVERKRPVRKFG
jgi:hypothetical protein